jgi:hypothetical protein
MLVMEVILAVRYFLVSLAAFGCLAAWAADQCELFNRAITEGSTGDAAGALPP